jgi:hypothetical protein
MALPRHVSFATSLVATLGMLQAHAAVIDHNSVDAVSSYSQGAMDKIGDLNYFFAHASVGGNMVAGLDALHANNANFYQLQTASASSTPPATVLDGWVYESNRGNPGWQQKLNEFDQALVNGWAGKVDLAMDKFCYIDQDAIAKDYLPFMAQMEGKLKLAGSGTRPVYATMPLTTGSGSDNILRNNFNTAVRSFVAGSSDRLLFDIADIEAWHTTGVQHTFVSGGKTYQQLYSGFTSDGGHPNGVGSQRVLGFYAVANAALVPEPESWAMFLAGLGFIGVIARRRSKITV